MNRFALIEGCLRAANRGSNKFNGLCIKIMSQLLKMFCLFVFYIFETANLQSYCGYISGNVSAMFF